MPLSPERAAEATSVIPIANSPATGSAGDRGFSVPTAERSATEPSPWYSNKVHSGMWP